jgi:mono/diheme cytochrome c family protein
MSLCIAVLLASLSTQLAWTAPRTQSAADGAAVFQQSCAGCHTIGGGRQVGPDLEGVTMQRDRDWLVRFISEPGKLLAEGDPIATGLLQEYGNVPMPALGLSADHVQAVIAYLESAGSGSSAPPASQEPTDAPPVGDPERGEALFAGMVDLHNGGPPCLGCHSADKTGLLGGGVLGPDLTQVADRYGNGLQAALGNIPWPTMAPIYTRHRLTPQEQADLLAFFQVTSGRQPVNREWVIFTLSLAGLAGALVVIGFVWRRRIRGVRRQMVEQARTK